MKAFGQASRNIAWDLGSGLERREQIRFCIRALVKFEWIDGDGTPRREQGFTRDISSKGLFIVSDSQPPAKADLHVDVFFGKSSGGEPNLELSAKTLVIRSEPAANAGIFGGFAVLNRSYCLANQAPILDTDDDLRNEPN
jgi:hypothetical protein